MEILSREKCEKDPELVSRALSAGELIIYPTDTIYGIGCDATNSDAVAKIRDLKKRDKQPFSILAPSKEWIISNLDVTERDLQILPGPYTIIAKQKELAVARNVNPNDDTLGVRYIAHWFQDIITSIGLPIVTTSVNIHDMPHMTDPKQVPAEIQSHVRYLIDEGIIEGESSKKIQIV